VARAASVASGASRLNRPVLKLALLAVVLVGFGATIGFSVSQEIGGQAPATNATQPLRGASRRALSADEQAYVQALWPIHTDLEVAAERVAIGTIFYKSNDLDRSELKSRLEEALTSYRAAGGRLNGLQPPPSLQGTQNGYVTVVSLFEQSAVEMLKMFDDGSDEHLQTAYPVYLESTNRIRDLGGTFWPDEFPPN
jgi:hypothetical protein